MRYTKAALPSPQLIARWRAKGLVIADIAAAERALTFVGYFRLSFGKWSQLYRHLQKAEAAHPNPKKAVAKTFGLSVSLMESWLHALTILRNTCAHHGRVWNRRFAYRPEVYAQAPHHFTDQQSFYCYAVVMRLCSRLIDVGNDWPIQLHDLFRTHPTIVPAELGFPANWHADPIWN